MATASTFSGGWAASLPRRKHLPMRNLPIAFWIFLSLVLILFALPPLLFLPTIPAPGSPNAPAPISAFEPSVAALAANASHSPMSVWDAMQAGNKIGPHQIELALTSLRDEDGRPFLEARKRDGWTVYAGLHIVPALVWSVAMPLQHVKHLRSTYPVVHRVLGYATLSSATILSSTGLLFPILGLTYSHPDFFHVHVLRVGASRIPVFAWPTFTLQTHTIGVALLVTTYFTVVTARARDFVSHRWWAQTHTYLGYVIPLQRVSILAHMVAGHVVARLPQHAQEWLHYPTTDKDAWTAERAMFACSTWVTFLAMSAIVWRANRRSAAEKVKAA